MKLNQYNYHNYQIISYILMALYGVELDYKVKQLQLELKLHLAYNENINYRKLKEYFITMDQNNNCFLNCLQFQKALSYIGFIPSQQDIQALFIQYDKNKDGKIYYQQFLSQIRTPMNEKRQKIIETVFNKIDQENKGKISSQQIQEHLNIDNNIDFEKGRKSKDQIVQELLNNFKNQVITREDFFNYYDEMSMILANDDNFFNLVQKQWGIKPEINLKDFDQQIKNNLYQIKLRILTTSKSITEENSLKKIFMKYNLDKSAQLKYSEFRTMISDLNIQIPNYIYDQIILLLDQNQLQYIEFKSFCQHLLSQNLQ